MEVDKFEENNGTDYNQLLTCLESEFGGNKEQALREANNDLYEAVVKLAEQISRLYEVGTKLIMKKLSEFIWDLLNDNLTISQFNEKVKNVIGRSANSGTGIVSDDSAITKIGTRINSAESIYKLMIDSCNYLQDKGTSKPREAAELLLNQRDIIFNALKTYIKAGNDSTEQGEFTHEDYLKRIKNF